MTTLQKPKNLPNFALGSHGWVKSVGVGVAVIVARLPPISRLLGQRSPRISLGQSAAEHLTKTDAKFYGASWCPHCTSRNNYSAARPSVFPMSIAVRALTGTACGNLQSKDIKSYPTWIINGQRPTGVQSLDTLAQRSKYRPGENREADRVVTLIVGPPRRAALSVLLATAANRRSIEVSRVCPTNPAGRCHAGVCRHSINWLPTSKRAANRVLLDVRTKEEFDEVHILGAQSVPWANLNLFKKHSTRRPVVLY